MDMMKVSDLLAAKILNAAQAVELVQLKANAEIQRVRQIGNALIEQARAEVSAPPEHIYNMETQTFQPKSGPVPLSTNRRRQTKRATQDVAS